MNHFTNPFGGERLAAVLQFPVSGDFRFRDHACRGPHRNHGSLLRLAKFPAFVRALHRSLRNQLALCYPNMNAIPAQFSCRTVWERFSHSYCAHAFLLQ